MSTKLVFVFVESATGGASHPVTGIGMDSYHVDFDGGFEVAFVTVTDRTYELHSSSLCVDCRVYLAVGSEVLLQ